MWFSSRLKSQSLGVSQVKDTFVTPSVGFLWRNPPYGEIPLVSQHFGSDHVQIMEKSPLFRNTQQQGGFLHRNPTDVHSIGSVDKLYMYSTGTCT